MRHATYVLGYASIDRWAYFQPAQQTDLHSGMASPLLSFYSVNKRPTAPRSDGLSCQNIRPVLFNIAPMLYFGQDSEVVEYPAYWIDHVLIIRVLHDGETASRDVMCLLNKNLGLTRKMKSSWLHKRKPATTPSYTRFRPRNI